MKKKQLYLSFFKLDRLRELIGRASKEFKQNGLFGVLGKARIMARSPRHAIFAYGVAEWRKRGRFLGKDNLIKTERKNDKPLKIAYILPGTGVSGGVAVVLNHANRLLASGCDVSIISLNPGSKIDWFGNKVQVHEALKLSENFFSDMDVLIATHWSTAFYMDLMPARRKIYFIQSDERRFLLADDDVRLTEATYGMDCEYMTEAIWIQRWLKDEFGHDAYYVPNGLDEKLFFPDTPIEKRGTKPRVLLEGAIDFWFKGMDDAYRAVKDLDCEIWIVSSKGKPKPGWRCDRFFEQVSMVEMRRIYSSCDIFLKMSQVEGFFGPPMEAMACGCSVVVGKVTGYDEYIKDGHNALVVEMGDIESAKAMVKKLIDDHQLREKLIRGGYETAKEWSWDKSIKWLIKALNKETVEKMYTDDFPEPYDSKKYFG